MDNKERIMESAKDLFYARGYDAVGVQEIADGAGITKPTLYYYFGSKLGLLKALLENGLSSCAGCCSRRFGRRAEFRRL